jgi:hypothetical protein
MLKWSNEARAGGPDFSAVDSQETAEELHRQSVLHKLLLMPAEFGVKVQLDSRVADRTTTSTSAKAPASARAQ